MAQRTINHFYPSYTEAVQAVADLTAYGVPTNNISLVESETDGRLPEDVAANSAQNPAGTGATLGAAIGAGLGALNGIGAIALPFTEPLVAAGWIVSAVTFAGLGAVAGVLIGSLVRLGSRNKQAQSFAQALHSGQHLVMVRVDEGVAAQVEAVMVRPRAVAAGSDPRFDEEAVADPLTPAQETAFIHNRERTLQYKSE